MQPPLPESLYSPPGAAASAAHRSRAGRRFPFVRPDEDAFADLPAVDIEQSTRRVLTEGGDARIAIDAAGLNAYGCRSLPDPDLVALGSSTASVVSGTGFDAASALHTRLLKDPNCHAFEVERIRRRISGLSGARAASGTEIVLAASGTDILLIARLLAEGPCHAPVIAVMAEAAETGSGVPAALAGRHFAADTCSGDAVDKGAPAIAGAAHAPECVPVRCADGALRPLDDVDAEFAYRVEEVLRAGGRCLLVLTDVSKTGVIAPSPACARRLAKKHGQALEVLVDACQFRLSPESIAAYLQDDFMVAVTGSKFVTGPTFCGALLLPAAIARRVRSASLLSLRPYSTRAHWPATWEAAHELPDVMNTGLLLRWEAALAELDAFATLPAGFSEAFLVRWGAAVSARIAADPGLEALPIADLQGHRPVAAWDGRQTIFPFLVIDQPGRALRRHLGRDETSRLHRRLQGLGMPAPAECPSPGQGQSKRFQFGQAVACGHRNGVPVSALRVCASARNIVDASLVPDGIARSIDAVMDALDRVAVLCRDLRSQGRESEVR